MWYSWITQGVLNSLGTLPSWYTSVFLRPISTPLPLLPLILRSLPVGFQNPEPVVLFVTLFFSDMYSLGQKKYQTRSSDLIFANATTTTTKKPPNQELEMVNDNNDLEGKRRENLQGKEVGL